MTGTKSRFDPVPENSIQFLENTHIIMISYDKTTDAIIGQRWLLGKTV